MNKEQELKVTILEGTIKVFNEKGLGFTMDDLAKVLGMSKKTIYKVFDDKEKMFFSMVDYLFDGIKESKDAVIANDGLSTLEKIKTILGILPEGYKDIDLRRLYLLKDKYPQIYRKVEERLETGWESTIMLLEKGIEEGVIRPVKIPIVKMMMEAALEQFFQRDILVYNDITYSEALDEVVAILIDGIVAK